MTCSLGTFDKEKSGFAKTTSKVSLSYINHGVTPQKNITLRYWLNTADDPYAPTKTPYAEETVADEVQPGETVTYTFPSVEFEKILSLESILFGLLLSLETIKKQNVLEEGEHK